MGAEREGIQTEANMKRTVMVGTVEEWVGNRGKRPVKVFVSVKYTDGRLSITQVTGPTSNGDAISCGAGGPEVDRPVGGTRSCHA
jgi:hypothetical protein